jgi:hypothetical protein
VKTYTTRGGREIHIADVAFWAEEMFTDLVAALEIARAYQARCERLETMLEQADDKAEYWQDQTQRRELVIALQSREAKAIKAAQSMAARGGER